MRKDLKNISYGVTPFIIWIFIKLGKNVVNLANVLKELEAQAKCKQDAPL